MVEVTVVTTKSGGLLDYEYAYVLIGEQEVGLRTEVSDALIKLRKARKLGTDFTIQLSGRRFDGADGFMTRINDDLYEYQVNCPAVRRLHGQEVSFCRSGLNRLFKKGGYNSPKTIWFKVI
jgi:hypothetical protein